MSPSRRYFLLWPLAVVLAPAAVQAQGHPPCPAAPSLEASTVSVDTKTAADLASKLLAKVGVDVDVRTTRDSVLKDNPRADQAILVLTMLNVQCEMIWSDASLSGAQKAARFQKVMQDMLQRALGPVPVARSDGKRAAHDRGQRSIMVASADDLAGFVLLAQNDPAVKLPDSQTGFIRDSPFYVNDFNKYFVIVGSAPTEQAGVRLMNQFKAKAPKYEFVLYGPYGANPNYAVMMATWVPRDVATEALRLAQRDVKKDAYLWACRSSGDSC